MNKFVVTYKPEYGQLPGDQRLHRIASITFDGVELPASKVEIHQDADGLAMIVIHAVRLEVRVENE